MQPMQPMQPLYPMQSMQPMQPIQPIQPFQTNPTHFEGQMNNLHQTKDDDEDDAVPLLEELGINFEHIASKTLAVLLPTKPLTPELVEDADLSGPLLFGLVLGFFLLLVGKVHFGYIYGFGLIGCISLNIVLNLMTENGVDLYRTMSILGYALLPVTFLAGVNVFLDLKNGLGYALGAFTVLWCTMAATRFFEQTISIREQRFLIAYPLLLLYSSFLMLTLF